MNPNDSHNKSKSSSEYNTSVRSPYESQHQRNYSQDCMVRNFSSEDQQLHPDLNQFNKLNHHSIPAYKSMTHEVATATGYMQTLPPQYPKEVLSTQALSNNHDPVKYEQYLRFLEFEKLQQQHMHLQQQQQNHQQLPHSFTSKQNNNYQYPPPYPYLHPHQRLKSNLLVSPSFDHHKNADIPSEAYFLSPSNQYISAQPVSESQYIQHVSRKSLINDVSNGNNSSYKAAVIYQDQAPEVRRQEDYNLQVQALPKPEQNLNKIRQNILSSDMEKTAFSPLGPTTNFINGSQTAPQFFMHQNEKEKLENESETIDMSMAIAPCLQNKPIFVNEDMPTFFAKEQTNFTRELQDGRISGPFPQQFEESLKYSSADTSHHQNFKNIVASNPSFLTPPRKPKNYHDRAKYSAPSKLGENISITQSDIFVQRIEQSKKDELITSAETSTVDSPNNNLVEIVDEIKSVKQETQNEDSNRPFDVESNTEKKSSKKLILNLKDPLLSSSVNAKTTNSPITTTQSKVKQTNEEQEQKQETQTDKSMSSILQPTSTCKILVIGNAKCGKTSIITRFISDTFNTTYNSTIGADYTKKDVKCIDGSVTRLQLWDIAGQDRFIKLTRAYFKNAKGVIIVCDVTREGTLEAVKKWKEEVDNCLFIGNEMNEENTNNISKVGRKHENQIPVVLVANKIDLLESPSASFAAGAKLATVCKEHGFLNWFCTSAKEGQHIEEAFMAVAERCHELDKESESSDDEDNEENSSGEEEEEKEKERREESGKDLIGQNSSIDAKTKEMRGNRLFDSLSIRDDDSPFPSKVESVNVNNKAKKKKGFRLSKSIFSFKQSKSEMERKSRQCTIL